MNLKENEKHISPDLQNLIYSGRIDFSDPLAPIFIFPASSVSMSFTGRSLKVLVKNSHSYYDNYIGYILDGVEKKFLLSKEKTMQEIVLAEDLQEDKSHKVIVFKRQDGCHEFTFCGFILSVGGQVNPPSKRFRRCIEFYGESAASGTLIEAVGCIDKANFKHNGEYSNAWHSYAMMTARNLKAQASIIAQEGISLLDNTGYFHPNDTIGMESIYDKLHFNPDLGNTSQWDFKAYIPQVVIIDIGQNDAFPEDFMKRDRDGEYAKVWKDHYRQFVLNIRKKYPDAFIVLTTTIVNHHPSWDRAIGLICREINDKKILHFLYSFNGRGTPFCIGTVEAEQMSFELSMFLKSLEPDIWQTCK